MAPPSQQQQQPTLTPSHASASDTADDDYLIKLFSEDDDAVTSALASKRSLVTQTPPPRPAVTPSARDRVLQQDISPTLERREVVRGSALGDKYVRVMHPGTDFFRRQGPDELEVIVPEPEAQSGTQRVVRRVRVALFGQPLSTAQAIHERLTKVKALAVLSSDAISSVAYATEASLAILITAGISAMQFNPWIAAAIAILIVIVGASYFQTIHAYPQGGGSYIVARHNLGDWPGLIAAAALLIDYVLTVSVSVSAGVDAIVSIDTRQLSSISVPLGVFFILVIMVVNLRGVRESGSIFAAPTYLFITVFFLMIGTGLVHAALAPGGLFTPIAPQVHPFGPPLGWAPEKLSLLLVLTAFASGCSAMTGVEAISNGVPAFHAPESKNAARTLIWMVAILVSLFVGTTYLAWRFGIEPYSTGEPTVTSQIAKLLFSGSPYTSWVYYVIQAATTLILILAANTSYADFPRLASILARDGWLPKGFSFRGNRLAFSSGIIVLTVLATLLMVAFAGNTEQLINLYALGVFTAFTLSQSGMVVHWWRLRNTGESGWRQSMIINGIGAFTTGLVAIVIMITKFDRGAWIVVVLVPVLVLLFHAISGHYKSVKRQIEQLAVQPASEMHTQAIAPVSRMDRVAEQTLNYARSLGLAVIVVHVATEQEDDSDFREAFYQWAKQIEEQDKAKTAAGAVKAPPPRLVIIRSTYRTLAPPFLEYVRQRRRADPTGIVTVFLPEYVPAHIWERLLHNETALRLKLALYTMRGVVVTNVPYQLGRQQLEPEREVELKRRRKRTPAGDINEWLEPD